MSRVTGAGAVWTYAFFVVFVCLILVCLVVVLVAAGLTDAVVAFWVVVVATAKAAVLPRALRLAAMAPAAINRRGASTIVSFLYGHRWASGEP